MEVYSEVHVELTTLCDFKCNFCPLTHGINRSLQTIKKEKAFTIIQEIADYRLAKGISYFCLGEPFLVTYLGELLEYASQRGIKNRLTTNGFLLSKGNKRVEKNLEYCDFLDISLRASDQESFAAMCKDRNASFADFLAGIKTFLAEVKKGKYHKTKIRLFVFLTKDSQNVLSTLGIDYEITSDVPLQTEIVHNHIRLFFEKPIPWTKADEAAPLQKTGFCEEYLHGYNILANGDLTPCTFDYDGHNAVGNIYSDGGIKQVLSNEKYLKFKQVFAKNIVPSDFCATCHQLNKKKYKPKFQEKIL